MKEIYMNSINGDIIMNMEDYDIIDKVREDDNKLKPSLKLGNVQDYLKKYKEVKDYNYAVNIVNYPFIVSSNGDTKEKYDITNPDDLLTLVKKGFYLKGFSIFARTIEKVCDIILKY